MDESESTVVPGTAFIPEVGRYARGSEPTEAAWNLVIFPPAGRGAAIYTALDTGGRDVVVRAVRLPGRETLFRSRVLTSVDSAVELLLPQVRQLVSRRPTVLFGHSLGAYLATGMADALQAEGIMPAALVVAGSSFPDRTPGPGLDEGSDEDLLAWLGKVGGTPEEILEDPEFMELILPVLRGDLKMARTYSLGRSVGIECPLVVLGGSEDTLVSGRDLDRWAGVARGPVVTALLGGGHFFPDHSMPEILRFVASVAGGPPQR